MFIYRKKKALSADLCQSFIQEFENCNETRPGVLFGPGGTTSTGGKVSTDLTFNPGYLEHPKWKGLLLDLIPVLEKAKVDYFLRHRTAMNKMDDYRIDVLFNMQRYRPEEGFFEWHCERAGLKHSSRVLVWMIYLNDLTDGGETEFFYQHHFETPEQGKLLVWPSDWTHLHRGIPSQTQTKYILTGWFVHFNQNE